MQSENSVKIKISHFTVPGENTSLVNAADFSVAVCWFVVTQLTVICSKMHILG